MIPLNKEECTSLQRFALYAVSDPLLLTHYSLLITHYSLLITLEKLF
ncbi:MAG: hypothetical protein F6K47_17200 [Symploca sp. SIO2E6]|nr:hypothetical protein [Symploca sp. SIO2E6]